MVLRRLSGSASGGGLAGSGLLSVSTGEGLTALVEEGVDVPANGLACAVRCVEDAGWWRRRATMRVGQS